MGEFFSIIIINSMSIGVLVGFKGIREAVIVMFLSDFIKLNKISSHVYGALIF